MGMVSQQQWYASTGGYCNSHVLTWSYAPHPSLPYALCRERRTKELMAAASQAVAQRRRPALATLETAIKMPGGA